VQVGESAGVEAGVWFRLGLGGITGHQDFARPTGVIVRPDEAVAAADAIVRVFIDTGDRTDRKKARLKYVLDDWGFDKFLAAVDAKLGKPLTACREGAGCRTQSAASAGAHRRACAAAAGPNVGRRGVAGRAHDDGADAGPGGHRARAGRWRYPSDRLAEPADLGRRRERAAEIEARLQAIGLTSKASSIRAGLVACTGNTGCKFAASNTKDTALSIAEWVEARVSLDTPINVHLTGCPNSCAQHYIGDVGLIACRVPIPDSDDTAEGFHVHVGGGFGPDAAIAREIYRDVKVEDCPPLIERMLKAYLANRTNASETFMQFSRRTDSDALRAMVDAQRSAA
jgi:ferredoxin-nitrite reductase